MLYPAISIEPQYTLMSCPELETEKRCVCECVVAFRLNASGRSGKCTAAVTRLVQ